MRALRLVLLAPVLGALLTAPAAAAAARSPSLHAPLRTLAVGHQRIGYREFGSGRPLVLIMGLVGTIDGWDPAFVDRLAAHHRVIMFDNRGIGRSNGTTRGMTIRTMAGDALAVIRRLRLRRPDVLGWSMGGFIAQDLVIRHPHVARRLVLAATMPHAPFGVQPSNDVIALLAHLPPNPADALAVLFPPDQARALTAYVTRILRYRPQETVPVPTFVAQLGAVIGWSAGPGGDDPRRIHIPTLVAHGDSDRLIPPENARVLARRIPRARLLVYRDSAHGFLSQYASAFARRVNAFLR